MEPGSIGVKPLIDSWIKLLPEQMRKRQKFIGILQSLFNEFV
jgi:hypothetical protein